MMWRLFMSSSRRAVIHLGQNYEKNLETYKFTNFEQIENLFSVTQNLVADSLLEILNVKTIDPRSVCWTRSTLPNNQVKKVGQKQKCRVHSDSVRCLGKIPSRKEAKTRWASQVSEFQVYSPTDEFLGVGGEALEFEWNIFPGFTTLQILREIQNDLQNENKSPEQFLDRIIFMSMFNDIEWTKKNNEEICTSMSQQVKQYAIRFQKGHWTVIGPGDDRIGMEQEITDQKEDGMLQQQRWYGSSRRPIIPSSQVSLLQVVEFWNKWKIKTSIHFNAEMTNSDSLFKIIFSANQLSIYGAVADWCHRFGAKENEQAGNPSAHEETKDWLTAFNKRFFPNILGDTTWSEFSGVNSKTDRSFWWRESWNQNDQWHDF